MNTSTKIGIDLFEDYENIPENLPENLPEWAKLKTREQRLFNALADNLCGDLCLTKWSY